MKFVILVALLLFLYIVFRASIDPSSGSGGLSPTGGMRNNVMEQAELSNRNITYPSYDVSLYDYSGIPEQTVWKIGHWSNPL